MYLDFVLFFMFSHCLQTHGVHEGIFIAFLQVRVEIGWNIKKNTDANSFLCMIYTSNYQQINITVW